MPQTRSQSKLLSTILYAEDTSTAATDQAIANSTASIDSSSAYQPESSPESSFSNPVASVAPETSVDSPPNPTVLSLERYKRTENREELPPTPKRVRFEPPQVSPVNFHRVTYLQRAYKTPEESTRFTREEDYPDFPKFSELLHLRPGLRSGLEEGFSRNISCGPSGYRLTLGTELIAEIEDIDLRRSELLEELGYLEQVKRRKLLSLEEILETQREELKISTIAEFGGHLERNTPDRRQPTTTFDKFGTEIQAHKLVEVDNPFTSLVEEGVVKRVLPNNVALVRLSNSDRIIGLFGNQIKSLE